MALSHSSILSSLECGKFLPKEEQLGGQVSFDPLGSLWLLLLLFFLDLLLFLFLFVFLTLNFGLKFAYDFLRPFLPHVFHLSHEFVLMVMKAFFELYDRLRPGRATAASGWLTVTASLMRATKKAELLLLANARLAWSSWNDLDIIILVIKLKLNLRWRGFQWLFELIFVWFKHWRFLSLGHHVYRLGGHTLGF